MKSARAAFIAQPLRGPILAMSFLACIPAAHASPLVVDGPLASFTVEVTSFSEARFARTIKQAHDFSCGSAALATLLTHHYEHPASEAEIFQKMLEAGDQDLIRKSGFSLLDMKRYLKDAGYQSDGFRFTLEAYEKIGVPAIVLINDDGYRHFVVIKGMDQSHLLIGDPSKGTRYIPREDFLPMWNGIVFVIRSHKNIAVRHFNDGAELAMAAKAPLEARIEHEDIASFLLSLPGRHQF